MKTSAIDPRKLLGFRVLLADAVANGQEPDLSDSRLGEKLGPKPGLKIGLKEGRKN
jgi:hypothetical protein